MKNRLIKRTSSNYFENGNSNDSITTKFTSEFSSCNSKYFSPIHSLKSSYTNFFSSYNKKNQINSKKKNKKTFSKSITDLNNKKNKSLKIISYDSYINKVKSPSKYDNLNSFQLLNKIKYEIKDKIKRNLKNKKKRNFSLIESINYLKESVHKENQNYIFSQNNKQDIYNSTEILKQNHQFNEILNDNINYEIQLIIDENNKMENLINNLNVNTQEKNNLIKELTYILQKAKNNCFVLSNQVNKLIEDKKYLTSCLLDKKDKISKLKEKLYQQNLKSHQMDSHLKSIIIKFENSNLTE